MKYTRVRAIITLIMLIGAWLTMGSVCAARISAGQPITSLKVETDSRHVTIRVITPNPAPMRHATLDQPNRIWMDIQGVVLPEGGREIAVGKGGVSSVKIGQFRQNPPVARMVVCLDRMASYRVTRSDARTTLIMQIDAISGNSAELSASTTPKASPVRAAASEPRVGSSAKPMSLPAMKPIPSPVTLRPRDALGDEAPAKAEISLDFRNTDIHDVLKALSVQSGVNIVVSESAKGNITIRLHGSTVEESLQMVARMANLDYRKVDSSYLVGSLDEIRRVAAVGGVTEVYTLHSLKPTEAQALLEKAVPHLTVQSQTAAGTLVIVGDSEDVRKALQILAQVDKGNSSAEQQPEARSSKVFKLNYLNAATAMTALRELLPDLRVVMGPEPFSPPPARLTTLMALNNSSNSSSGTSSGSSGNPTSGLSSSTQSSGDASRQGTPEGTRTKTIILSGLQDQVDQACAILKEIDVAPAQVMIEAKVMDIAPESTKDLGLEWTWGTTKEPNNGKISFVEPVAGGTEDSLENQTHDIGFGSFGRWPAVIDAKLNALIKDRKASVLANPKIAVLDNEEANIFIGDIMRYQVVKEVTETGPVMTVEDFPVGIALLVRPRVNTDGMITMKIHPVVSRISGIQGGLPQTSSRETDSTIRIREGETFVIGGLLQEEEISEMSKIPILGDLPMLGQLFRNRSSSHRKSEITIFITPHIVNGE